MIKTKVTMSGIWLTAPEKALAAVEDFIPTAMNAGMAIMLEAAQRKLVEPPSGMGQKTYHRGALFRSLQMTPVKKVAEGFRAYVRATAPHAPFMEYGTKPHTKHPPGGFQAVSSGRKSKKQGRVWVSVLDPWIKERYGITGSSVKAMRERAGIAFLIGRKMKRKGIAGRHYMQRAYDEVGQKCADETARLLADKIREVSARA